MGTRIEHYSVVGRLVILAPSHPGNPDEPLTRHDVLLNPKYESGAGDPIKERSRLSPARQDGDCRANAGTFKCDVVVPNREVAGPTYLAYIGRALADSSNFSGPYFWNSTRRGCEWTRSRSVARKGESSKLGRCLDVHIFGHDSIQATQRCRERLKALRWGEFLLCKARQIPKSP